MHLTDVGAQSKKRAGQFVRQASASIWGFAVTCCGAGASWSRSSLVPALSGSVHVAGVYYGFMVGQQMHIKPHTTCCWVDEF